jgi:hypothetical protein
MMDWSESSSFSISWTAACARCVHQEIKENLETANESRRSNAQWRLRRSCLTANSSLGFSLKNLVVVRRTVDIGPLL